MTPTSPPETTAYGPGVEGTPAPRRRWTTRPPGSKGKGKVAHPECPAWVRSLAVPYEGEAEFLLELDRRGAAKSVRRLVRHLNAACARNGQPGRFDSIETMAANSGIAPSTIRKGFKWLAGERLIVRDKVRAYGRSVWMTWCLWLLPSARPDGPAIGLDQGVDPGDRNSRSGPLFSSPGRALFGRQWRPKKGANCSKGISSERETTDRVRGASSSSPAPPGGGEPEIPAAPEPDPAIVAELVDLDETTRAEVVAEAPAWLARWKLAWIALAIRETAGARKRKTVHSFAGFAAKMLENWEREGRPTTRHCLAPTITPGSNSADRPESAKLAERDAKARELAEIAARDAALKARWAALPDPDRAAMVARVEADNPEVLRFRMMLEPLCLAALEARESAPIE